MRCPKCQHENHIGDKFCRECGTKLPAVCPHCGHEVSPQDRFCSECGTRLTVEAVLKPALTEIAVPKLEDMQARLYIPEPLRQRMHSAGQEMAGENRLVTALFADISGFTSMSQRLMTETVVEKVNQCFKTITDAVYHYEGSVNRFIGDCVLAFFGAPLSHENDPERAILAALAMRQEVQKLELNISVGVNTGMMYFGPIGTPEHHEVSAYGPDINLAKRLQEAAKPGQILVGEGIYRLTRRAFEFEPLPPLTLKNIQKPVMAYAALKVLPRPEKLRGIEGLKAPMIGRDEEFAKIITCLDDLMKGRGQLVSIIGVAGVGKSRLVMELKKRLESSASSEGPYVWLDGRCLSIGESVSYWVFIDILKSYFKFEATDDERAMGEKITSAVNALVPQQAEEILPLFGNLLSIKFGNELDDRLKFASPEQVKHQTFMALRDLFLALANRQPLVLVFEDLHWADSHSLDLILLLMEMLTLAPLMLVCVYRPEQEHKSWRIGTIASSKCLERYTEIRLHELSRPESRRMVEELLRIENLPEDVKKMILNKSEGNPFFVEEVIRSLIDSGLVYQEGETWRAKGEIELLTVPDTIQSVIMSRIDRLEEEVRYVLQCAAVIGRLFRHRLLGYTSQRERELDRHLLQLEDRELVYEERAVPELEYSFKHVLTQETAYQSLLGRRRQEFHRKVGEGIEALYRDRINEYYEQLAYHYDKGSIVEKAVEYLLLAGEKARRAYLNDEAIGYFERALELLDSSPSGESRKDWRLAALKGLGQIYHGIGKELEAEGYFRQAIVLGQEMGLSARELVRLYFWLGYVLAWQCRYDEMICLGEEGLALLGDDTESFEAALMNSRIAVGHMNKGNWEKCREFIYRNAPLIQRLPYSEELGPAHVHMSVVYQFEKNIEEWLKWLQAVERKAEQHHDLRTLGEAHRYTGIILANRGDLCGAILRYQRGLELITKIGDAKFEGHWRSDMGRHFLSLGDCQKAEEYAYRALEMTKILDNKRDMASSHIAIGTISLCHGSPEKATDAFQKAVQLYREIGHWQKVWAELSLGRAYLAAGKRPEALRQFQELVPMAKTDPVLLAAALSGLEEAYEDAEEFRAFCHRFREEHPEFRDSSLIQWFLEPTEAKDFPKDLFRDEFVGSLSPSWEWHDQFGDCSFRVQNGPALERSEGLEIHAANGRDLWRLNLSAPRILQSVSGNFAAQTVCPPFASPPSTGGKVEEEKPAIGGILLWKDKENFLRLETKGRNEIRFEAHVASQGAVIGRGRLPSKRVFLRLERPGSRVNALCSADGVSWFTVGYVEFPVEDPVEVGLLAIGNIDRTIYHGAFPEGTAIRFESFELYSS